ncbi:Kelch domain-containing protein [Apiospora kogelbergensis]|uniref:Kelch domain-containing protein n=1 Tax=Apiospora kogelbergensis TaxID=1337665 RepID=UPI00312FEB00
MAFLFKSKKSQDRAPQSRDGPSSASSLQSAAGRVARDDKAARSTPTGSLNSIDNDASPLQDPEKYAARRAAAEQQQQQQQQQSPPSSQQSSNDLPFRNSPSSPNNNSSLYPWSQRRMNFTSSIPSPFPRYGAAVNSVSSKEGDIYVMGGLINSSTVKGDLWLIEAGGSLSCYPLATTAEGPGPRVGHASLLVGNAFIVYGGDTKIDETDLLDETLYLLNTSTRQWSRALPAGPRPTGRYGHSLNILGSKIYIFGGQVEGYFMNDLAAFDLNQLQAPNNKWEVLIENTDTAPTKGKVPPARTNHSMVTYNDKLYLFGGTNGFQWFNDVWCYDPAINQWSQLDCIGYIPVPREGHAAALVDDVMYVFGGRTEEGADLGDLAAFRIASRRWYTFQNMGPSPSPRSGHSMTTVGKGIVVVGGEPSSTMTTVNDLSFIYVLDTTKIRYPNDAQIQSNTQKMQQARRPSGSETPQAVARLPTSREVSIERRARENGPGSPTSKGPNGPQPMGPAAAAAAANAASKLPRAADRGPPQGPPPQGQPPRPTVNTTPSGGRARNASIERIERETIRAAAGSPSSQTGSPIAREVIPEESPVSANGRRTPNQQPNRPAPKPGTAVTEPARARSGSTRQTRGQGSVDSSTESTMRNVAAQSQPPASAPRPASPPPPTRQPSNPLSRRGSSGRNSQTVALLKELDTTRNRNAWYASELELARKSGYVPNTPMSPTLEKRGAETFDEEDRPLIEALLAMKQELANVQNSVDKQAILAAKQIAEAERQRDAAIQEAVYAKAKMAAQTGSTASTPQLDQERDVDSRDRTAEISRKFAAALDLQKGLQNQLERINSDLDAEKRARQLADETAGAAQKRMADLETYKQQTSLELESLRAELHDSQHEAREQATAAAEAVAAMQMLRVEHSDLQTKYEDAPSSDREGGNTLDSLREALAASADMRNHFESKLEEERANRQDLETKLTTLKAEHEASTAELVGMTQRLRDAEELAERHAAEAKVHRQAVISGLDKVSQDGAKSKQADSDRIVALQGQVNAANNLVRKYQQEANTASDKLRTAEERIAGLEAYQEQSSREGVTIRRQLQAAMKDTQSLQALNSDLKHQLANQQLETNAMTVQYSTLKDILAERGLSPTGVTRARNFGSRNASPTNSDLEQQLAEAKAAHEETKQNFEIQSQQAETAYRERVQQLESDYQSAVHYVKGTEKMLKRMKEELSKFKTDNARLKTENIELEERAMAGNTNAGSGDWEPQRAALEAKIQSLEDQVRQSSIQLEKQLSEVRRELEGTRQERDKAKKTSAESVERLTSKEKDLEQMQQDYAQLEKRALDAEHKVGLLLDQVENSVDNYRRRSRQVPMDTPNLNGLGHSRQESSEAESLYGGLGDARNSAALDNLADELDQLRSKWEATNENYRLSNAFDFETAPAKKSDEVGLGLSASLADWRKRLDTEEQEGTNGTKHAS